MNKIILGSIFALLLVSGIVIADVAEIDWFKLYEITSYKLASCEVQRDMWHDAYDNYECPGGGSSSSTPELKEPTQVLGDINGDGWVDEFDEKIVKDNWGCEITETDNCGNADLDGDGYVSGVDLTIIISNWNSQRDLIEDNFGREDCVEPDWCNGADLNQDGKVGGIDLTMYLS